MNSFPRDSSSFLTALVVKSLQLDGFVDEISSRETRRIVEFTTDARGNEVPVQQNLIRFAKTVNGAIIPKVLPDLRFTLDAHVYMCTYSYNSTEGGDFGFFVTKKSPKT